MSSILCPPAALLLLIALLSEQDLGRYGGVCPGALAYRDEAPVIGSCLPDWDTDSILKGLGELEDRGFVSHHPCAISRLDSHLMGSWFPLFCDDQQRVEVLAVRTW